MTLEEFSSVFDIKPSYVKSHWNRIVESKRRQNIEVYKIKCFNFLQKEREMLDSGEINIEDIS